MKKFISFFKSNLRLILKFFVTQIAISALSIVVTLSVRVFAITHFKERTAGAVIASIICIIIFAIVVHDFFWQEGAKDRIKVDGGRIKRDNFKGAKIALCSLLPVIVLTVVASVSYYIGIAFNNEAAASVYIVSSMPLYYLFEGMYYGIATVTNQTVYLPIVLVLEVVCSTLIPAISYAVGMTNKTLRSYFGLGSVDIPEKKNKK